MLSKVIVAEMGVGFRSPPNACSSAAAKWVQLRSAIEYSDSDARKRTERRVPVIRAKGW